MRTKFAPEGTLERMLPELGLSLALDTYLLRRFHGNCRSVCIVKRVRDRKVMACDSRGGKPDSDVFQQIFSKIDLPTFG